MALAVLRSRALAGMRAPEVTVEVHVASGLPTFTIVGLADTEVRESRDRVRAALRNSGFEFPAGHITVNLAPPICRKSLRAMTCRLRSAFWRPVHNCPAKNCMSMNLPASCHCPANCARFALRWR